jgi:hypothetical protein
MTHRAIALLPLLTTGLAFADTITVCPDGTCDHVDIASAVAAATAGDVIAVGAGTYAVSTPIELDDRDLVIEGGSPSSSTASTRRPPSSAATAMPRPSATCPSPTVAAAT